MRTDRKEPLLAAAIKMYPPTADTGTATDRVISVLVVCAQFAGYDIYSPSSRQFSDVVSARRYKLPLR